jgi:hypothetical protein
MLAVNTLVTDHSSDPIVSALWIALFAIVAYVVVFVIVDLIVNRGLSKIKNKQLARKTHEL